MLENNQKHTKSLLSSVIGTAKPVKYKFDDNLAVWLILLS
jgi:hypothetical protein